MYTYIAQILLWRTPKSYEILNPNLSLGYSISKNSSLLWWSFWNSSHISTYSCSEFPGVITSDFMPWRRWFRNYFDDLILVLILLHIAFLLNLLILMCEFIYLLNILFIGSFFLFSIFALRKTICWYINISMYYNK